MHIILDSELHITSFPVCDATLRKCSIALSELQHIIRYYYLINEEVKFK